MDCSTPGLPVHHQLPEFTQVHVHLVGDVIQPSHPPSSPFTPTFNLSQHQSLFKWIISLHHVAKVLEFQLHRQTFHEYSGLIFFRMDWLDLLESKGLSRVFSNTTVQKHQFSGAHLSLYSNSHTHTTGKTIALTRWTFVGKVMSLLFNVLSRLVITFFFPKSKHLLISWL